MTRQLPYKGNHPRKKTFANYLLCHSLREIFRNSGNLIYKNSDRDKKCKKTFTNASRFAKFAKLPRMIPVIRYLIHVQPQAVTM